MGVFLICEIGVNHGGRLSEAMRLVEAAKGTGADAVKFQLFKSRKLWGDDRIKHLELSFDAMTTIERHCERAGIEFMCTPFGVEELAFLKPMLKRVKIASGCLNRTPLIECSRDTGLPVILSTGMSMLSDVTEAVSILGPCTLLHCTSAYPCRLEDVNLRAMDTLQATFPVCNVGYSDHTNGITVSLAAVARGATVIEKHLTLDRNAVGPDHKASITPSEMKALRLGIIEIEAALGDRVKRVQESEQGLREAWGRD